VAVVCVSLSLLLQSLAPPGYMAGSVENGWPVILCPEGLPSGFMGHDGHAHHHDAAGAAEDVSLDGHCPLGSVLDATASLAVPPYGAGQPLPVTPSFLYAAPLVPKPVSTHPTRAPPARAW